MQILPRRSLWRASLLAVVLLAAACGSSETDTVAVESDGDGADTSAEPDTSGDDDAMAESDDDAMEESDDDAMEESDDDAMEESDSDSEPAGSPPVSLPPDEAAAAATENLPNLQPSDDVRDLEMLAVTSGEITTLRDVVAGDRPVLLWFWAPH